MLTKLLRALALFVVIGAFELSTAPHTFAQSQQIVQQPSPANVGQMEPAVLPQKAFFAFWDRTWRDPVAFYTLVLACFTGLLAAVSIFQGFFLVRADKTARRSAEVAERGQRAYVNFSNTMTDRLLGYEIDGVSGSWLAVRGFFENSGLTQALNVNTIFSVRDTRAGEEPAFDLPKPPDRGIPLGPHMKIETQTKYIPFSGLQKIYNKSIDVYLLFRVEYRDAFSPDKLRHTQICYRLEIFQPPNEWIGAAGVVGAFRFYTCPEFSSAG